MDDLNEWQHGLLVEFGLITGTAIDDEETKQKAIALLRSSSFDLNGAVIAFFDHGLDSVSTLAAPEPSIEDQIASFSTGTERFESALIHRNLQDEFATDYYLPKLPKAPRIGTNWQFELGIHVSMQAAMNSEKSEQEEKPKRSPFMWILLLIVPKAFSLLLSFIRFIFGFGKSSLYKAPRRSFNYDNYEEDYDFMQEIKEEAGNFNIATKGFDACHEKCQKEFVFLLVVLVNDTTVNFARQLIASEQFAAQFHKETGTYKETHLFISNTDRSPEAFEVAKTYRRKSHPYVVLVGNVTNNPAVMSSMSVVYKSNLFYTEEDVRLVPKVIKNINKSMIDYNPQLVTKRYDKQEIELSRLIKEKQDEAYLDSLHQDKVKKIEKEKKKQEVQAQKDLQDTRNALVTHLIETKWFEKQLESSTPQNLVRVSIKLPDGKRVVQKFLKSMSLSHIYLFVDTLVFSPVECDGVDMNVEDYCSNAVFDFEVFKPFPKVALPSSGQTIEEFSELKSGDSILVEYLENTDE